MTRDGQVAKFIHADLTKPTETKALVQQAGQHFGSVDILVNNAGMQHIDAVENFIGSPYFSPRQFHISLKENIIV